MTITANFHAALRGGYLVMKPTDVHDSTLVEALITKKSEREAKVGGECPLQCSLALPNRTKTDKQRATVWKLVECIFASMEGRKPCTEEREETYRDLLEVYAPREPSKIRADGTHPVHLSKMDSVQAAQFIDALLTHLASECGLATDIQAEVRGILFEWERWRGEADTDYLDGVKASDWRPVYSEASGLAGGVDKHHILSRGAYPQYADKAWNLLALTREEHEFFHSAGMDRFMARYPHLEGRIWRARKMGVEG